MIEMWSDFAEIWYAMVLEGSESKKSCVINMAKIARWRMHREPRWLCFMNVCVG